MKTTFNFRMGSRFLLIFFMLTVPKSERAQCASEYANVWGLLGTATTGFGRDALLATLSTNGSVDCSALGWRALYNAIGTQHTAIGARALLSETSANDNTAAGYGSLGSNNSGIYNTACGYEALIGNTVGQDNTSIGFQALATGGNSNGNQNTAVGALADISSASDYNQTALGYQAFCYQSNMIRLGNTSVATFNCNIPLTVTSDGRFKTNVREGEVKGLDFILRLKPLTYNFDGRAYILHVTGDLPAEKKAAYLNQDFYKSYKMVRSGFLAQEVEEAANSAGYDFDAIHKPTKESGAYGLTYGQFVVPLVKAVQEQQEVIDQIGQKIDERKKMIDAQKNRDVLSSDLPANAVLSLDASRDKGEIRVNIEKQASDPTSLSGFLILFDVKGKLVLKKEINSSDRSATIILQNAEGARFCAFVFGGSMSAFKEIGN